MPFWNGRFTRRTEALFYTLVVFCAALVVGAVVFLQSDYVRDKASGIGSSRLGRELVIDGPLAIDWNWRIPRITAHQVRLANMPDLKDANMLEIEKLDFTINIWKLLIGRLELPSVDITKPVLVLEKIDDDTKNWDMPAFSSGNTATNAVLAKERGDFPIIGRITLTEGTLVYRDRTKDLDTTLKLDTASGSGSDKDEDFTLTGKGTLSGKEFTLDATGGSLLSLRNSDDAYPLKADIVMGPTVVHLDGLFRDPLKMEGVDTALTLKGENLADLFYLTSIPLPPTPAYNLKGRLGKSGDVWSFHIAEGKVGNSDLKADGTYDISGERGFLKANLESQTMRMEDLGGFIGMKPTKSGTKAPANRVFPDVPLNLDRLRASDLDVTMKATHVYAPGLPFQSLDVRFLLDNGLLRLDPFNAGIAGGTMTGFLVLDGREETPRVETDLQLRRLSLKEFFDNSRFESLSGGRFGGRIMLEGRGKTLADVLGSSDGHISLLMAGGQVSLMLVEAAGIDIAEFTGLLLGEDKTTTVRCAIGDFPVKKGVLRSDVFVFDTTDTNLEGDAQIDLKAETISAEIEAHPKDASPLSARTPILVRGPLKKPSVGINPTGLAARGAGAAALALLNPLAAIIPFLEPGGGEDTDCRGLIRSVRAKYDGALPGPTANQAPPKPAD